MSLFASSVDATCGTCGAQMREGEVYGSVMFTHMRSKCDTCGSWARYEKTIDGKYAKRYGASPRPKTLDDFVTEVRRAAMAWRDAREWSRLKPHELAHVAELEARIA